MKKHVLHWTVLCVLISQMNPFLCEASETSLLSAVQQPQASSGVPAQDLTAAQQNAQQNVDIQNDLLSNPPQVVLPYNDSKIWGSTDYSLAVSKDDKTLTFTDNKFYFYKYSYDLGTKKITDLSVKPPKVIDPQVSPGDWINVMNELTGQAANIKNAQSSASDKQMIQGYIDQMKKDVLDSGIKEFTDPSGNLTFVFSPNVVEVRQYSLLQFGLDKTTKAVTYRDSQGKLVTVDSSDFNDWFAAGQNMLNACYGGTGYAGVSATMYDTVNAALGVEYEIHPAGPVSGPSLPVIEASRYPDIIFVKVADGGNLYLDLKNHIVYSGVYGQGGYNRDNQIQFDGYYTILQQMLDQASSYNANTYLTTTDKQNLQKLINDLNKEKSAITTVTDGSGTFTFVFSPNVVEIQQYGQLKYSLNKTTKAITYVDDQRHLTTVGPADSFNRWFAAGQKMLATVYQFNGAGYAGVNATMYDTVNAALGVEYEVHPPSGPSSGVFIPAVEASKYSGIIFVQLSDGGGIFLDTVNKIVYAGAYGANGIAKSTPSQTAQYNALVQKMLDQANAYVSNVYLASADKQNLQKIIDLLKSENSSKSWVSGQYSLSVASDGHTLTFVSVDPSDGYRYVYDGNTAKILDLKTVPPVTIDPALNPGDWINVMDGLISEASTIKKSQAPADQSKIQSFIDLMNSAKLKSNIQVRDDGNFGHTFVFSPNVVEIRQYGLLQFSLNKTTKAITYVNAKGQLVTVAPSDFNAWFAAGQSMLAASYGFNGAGYSGTGAAMYDAVNAALGMQYEVHPPSGLSSGAYIPTIEASKYTNVIFIQLADGGGIFLDTVNKIVYAGVYGVNGIAKSTPSQTAQYNTLVQQMLSQANAYIANVYLASSDKQNLQKIIDLLKS